jgi:hypothetical protein
VTIVSGGPGTGKTAVALHRAAYLLYSDRNRFAGGGVLVVGPSGVFVEYISSVLPSLGEEAATLQSLGSLVAGVTATRSDLAEVAAIKGSLRMRRVLERAVRDAVPDGPGELRLLYRGELLRLTRYAGPASTGSSTPCGSRRRGCTTPRAQASPAAGCRTSAGSKTTWPSGTSSGTSSGRGGPGCSHDTYSVGWPGRSGCGRTPRASCPPRRSGR